jgi:acyl-CoA dehydrogenase
MVDFSFTDEQELIGKALREWCEKTLPLEKIREIDDKHEISKEIIKRMADLGFLLMTIPEEHGGIGADWVTTCIAAEELGYADISIAIPVFFIVESSWGFIVDKYCSEQVREEFVEKAIKGEGFIGIASTEEGGGSDVSNVKSTAKKEHDTWVLNGEKLYVSGTEEAKKWGGGYFVLVRTSPPPTPEKHHLGMTAFFLPINAVGVETVKRFEKMGRMGISTGGIVMDNVCLQDYHRIGEDGKGFYLTMEGFDVARLLIGASCLGAAKRALEIGMSYTKERVAFGRPIAKFEAIQFELADDWAELEALRSLVYRTAWMMDKKYEEKFSAINVSKYVSACKLKIPPFAFDVFKRVMLWFGAYGYTKDCPLEMGLRGVMSYMIGAEGTLNIQRTIIARELLGKKYIPYR